MAVNADAAGSPVRTEPSPAAGSRASRAATVLDAFTILLLLAVVLVTVAGRVLFFNFGQITLPSTARLLAYAVIVLVVRHVALRQSTIANTLAGWHARLEARPHLAAAVRAFVSTRLLVFVVAHFAVVTIGLAPTANFKLSSDPFGNLPARFDAGWYGALALDGYEWDRQFDRQRNIAFFPALPMLMRPVGSLLGANARGVPRERRLLRALWGGVFISLTAFFFALIYLSKLSGLLAGDRAAAAAPILLAAYPFAVFFNAPYTEGLFLLGSVGAFFHFHRRQWVPASLFGLLVGVSRPNGCFVAVPLALLAIQQVHQEWRIGRSVEPLPITTQWRPLTVRLLVASMPGLSMLVFTLFLYRLTGVWFAWARMQGAWGRKWGTGALAQGWEWLTTEGFMSVSQGVPFDTLNTLAVLFVVTLLWQVFRRLGLAYGVFVLLNLVPPVFAGGALSMGRVSSTLFPVFIALAALLPERAVPAWAASFAVLQGLVAAIFFTWRELF